RAHTQLWGLQSERYRAIAGNSDPEVGRDRRSGCESAQLWGESRLLGRLEAQGNRVDALPQGGGGVVPLAGEDVSEVRSAGRTAHLGAHHAQRAVLDLDDAVASHRREEGRPAAPGVELLRGPEQFGAACAA